MVTAYDQLFNGEKISMKHKSQLEDNNYPELDPSEFLDDVGIKNTKV